MNPAGALLFPSKDKNLPGSAGDAPSTTSKADPREARTDNDWHAFIRLHTEEMYDSSVEEDGSLILLPVPPGPLTDIKTPADPRFPLTIDHTLLKQDAAPHDIDILCAEAVKYGFKSCCVNGIYVKQVAERLKGTKVIPCAVVGFPLGAGSAEVKAYETRVAIQDGAREIDVVLPLGYLLAKPPQYSNLYKHLRMVIAEAKTHKVPVKVILETSLIPRKELKVAASVIAAEAGAAFVKTSTGFAGGGATKEDVELMHQSVTYSLGPGVVGVKASGGVRTFEKCREMFLAGAERIGTSSGVAIVANTKTESSGY